MYKEKTDSVSFKLFIHCTQPNPQGTHQHDPIFFLLRKLLPKLLSSEKHIEEVICDSTISVTLNKKEVKNNWNR